MRNPTNLVTQDEKKKKKVGMDGLGRGRAADLPAEVRQYHRLGQVPVGQLGLFKLPPSWTANQQTPDSHAWE